MIDQPRRGSSLLAGLVVAIAAGQAFGQAETVRYVFKDAVPMVVDQHEVLVRYADGGADRIRAGRLDLVRTRRQLDALAATPQLTEARLLPDAIGSLAWARFDAPANELAAVDARLDRIAASPAIDFASPVLIDELGNRMSLTRHMVVQATDQHAAAALENDLDTIGTIVEREYAGLEHAFLVRIDTRNGMDTLSAANALAVRGDVRFAEPEFVLTGSGNAVEPPSDEFFPDQWALNNTGQAGGTPGVDINVLPAWEFTRGGADIPVAFLDIGAEIAHPDLSLAGQTDLTMPVPAEGFDNAFNVCDIHGTWVAGILAATNDNGTGVTGVIPDSPVYSLRMGVSNVFTDSDTGEPICNLTWSASALWTADALAEAEALGVRVTNNSNAYNTNANGIATITAKYNQTFADGMVHFASAGNDGASGATYPAELSSVNAIGSIGRDGVRSFFSNRRIAVCAPGEFILTTDRLGDVSLDGDYGLVDGTSFASPLAAGVAAMVLSIDPEMPAQAVGDVIRRSARDLRDFGLANNFGSGLLDARAAIELAVSFDRWSDDAPMQSPSQRSNADAVFIPERGEIMLFGGTFGFSTFGDTWLFDGQEWSQAPEPGVVPSARYGHALASAPVGGAPTGAIMFGGLAGASPLSETWRFNGGWQQLSIPGPPARFLHDMVFDTARNQVVLFGGGAGVSRFNDTWTFHNQDGWQQVNTDTSPTSRIYHAMAFDEAREQTVMFGGSTGGNETWTFDGEDWTLASTEGPEARSRHAMVYDRERETVLLFGGLSNEGDDLRDVWEWNGTEWKLLADTGPAARGAASVAPFRENGRSELVVFGGFAGSSFFGDTWSYRAPRVDFLAQPQDTVAIAGETVVFDAPTELSRGVNYQWTLDGTPIEDSARFSGATTHTLTIAPVELADAGVYRLEAVGVSGSATSDEAALAVAGCEADYNFDGRADFVDALDFLANAQANLIDADLNNDFHVDADDVATFQAQSISGCGNP